MFHGRPDLLVACSIRRWVADDMRTGAKSRFPVHHDFGFDVPDVSGAKVVAWWAPAEHAARLLRAGVAMDLSAPGPGWLADVPRQLTGRQVWAGSLADMDNGPAEGWMKPAEAKVPWLPARWYSRDDFLVTARRAGFPADGQVQVSPVRLDLSEEHRCFVLEGEVLTSSPYLSASGTTYEEGWEASTDFDHASAWAFAREVVYEMGDEQPHGYTLDVGLTTSGRWVVIEANPAWCSGTYGCELGAVVDVVVEASATPIGYTGPSRHGHFVWRPDPYLISFAETRPLLTPRAGIDAGVRTVQGGPGARA